jgi:formylglycine-generating enzyme required for sulfatase activity
MSHSPLHLESLKAFFIKKHPIEKANYQAFPYHLVDPSP